MNVESIFIVVNCNCYLFSGFMKNMETMYSKVTARINEVDEWYEDKQQHILGWLNSVLLLDTYIQLKML